MVAGYFREASKVFEIDYWKRLVNIPILPFQEECQNTNKVVLFGIMIKLHD